MPKRVSGGESFTPDTSHHIATTTFSLDKRGRTKVHYDLFRTGADAFSLVELIETFSRRRKEHELANQVRYPLSYDQAHAFVRGEEIEVSDRVIGSMQVNILDTSVFPQVPEAAGDEEY